MEPQQRSWVQVMLWRVTQWLTMAPKEPHPASALTDAEHAKRFLLRTLATSSPILTENAWDTIVAEKDTDILAWDVALVVMDANEIHRSEVRRAFFENAELLRYAIAWSRDPEEMKLITNLV